MATPNEPEVRDEQRHPGSTETNPAGTSTPAPAEGADDTPERMPGSPRG
ncbi:hypothetical protein ACNFJ7_01490 [Sphingomonas sp. HT-1]|nr:MULTISPECIES: hypothetical protein [unclassified Sphingomonas]